MSTFNNYEKFPYTNYHGLNLDWILQKVKELDDKINTQIDPMIIDRIREIILVDSYDAETETLTISLQLPEA